MIAVTTDNGTLRIAAEIPIPQGRNWSPRRIQRLMIDIERHVFILEMADKADNDERKGKSHGKHQITKRRSAQSQPAG